MARLRLVGLAALLLEASVGTARADEPTAFTVIIRNHRFIPPELDVPAGSDVVVHIRNEDATAEQFDLRTLSCMEVVYGEDSGTVRLADVEAGQYPFFGDYHSGTAQGVLIAE